MTFLIFRMKSSGWSNKGQYLTLTSKLTNKIQYKLTHYFVCCKLNINSEILLDLPVVDGHYVEVDKPCQ